MYGLSTVTVEHTSGSVTVRLIRDAGHDALYGGGTATYRVLAWGRQLGLVGDGRLSRPGGRHGPQRWSACWWEKGDTTIRASSGLVYPTRPAALSWLVDQVTGLPSCR